MQFSARERYFKTMWYFLCQFECKKKSTSTLYVDIIKHNTESQKFTYVFQWQESTLYGTCPKRLVKLWHIKHCALITARTRGWPCKTHGGESVTGKDFILARRLPSPITIQPILHTHLPSWIIWCNRPIWHCYTKRIGYSSLFSFGCFPGVWGLKADVSEPSIGSIFLGRWRKKLFFLHLPRTMEPIEGSETSAFKPQTPGKHPKENILQSASTSSWVCAFITECLTCRGNWEAI